MAGLTSTCGVVAVCLSAGAAAQTTDDLIFIHHSVGNNWLNHSLNDALLAKDYVDERNDVTYGTAMSPDAGRPASLGGTPGNNTNMNHWILWFNDYLAGMKARGCADGANRIVMFKSCYPISNIASEGVEPGDPFTSAQTVTNYKSVYRHPDGPGNTYTQGGVVYRPLEDVFAANPDTLFVPVTAPPRHYAPSDATYDAQAQRARAFANWLKGEWLDGYNTAHPGLNNVAVFDLFDVLAYPDDHASHPNRLRAEYGGQSGDSHPNDTANGDATQVFATAAENFIDAAQSAFAGDTGYVLSLTVMNYPWGMVTMDPEPDAPNSSIYPPMTEVTLTAQANGYPDRYFAHWEIYDANHPGDANYAAIDANDSIVVVMDGPVEVRAVFRCGARMLGVTTFAAFALGAFRVVRRRA